MRVFLSYLWVITGFPVLVTLLSWVSTPIGVVFTMVLRRLGKFSLTEKELTGPVAGGRTLQACLVTVSAVWCARWVLHKADLLLGWELILVLLFVSAVIDWQRRKSAEEALQRASLGDLFGNAFGLLFGGVLFVDD